MKQATPNRLESVCVWGGGYLFSFTCEISKTKHNISSHLLTFSLFISHICSAQSATISFITSVANLVFLPTLFSPTQM